MDVRSSLGRVNELYTDLQTKYSQSELELRAVQGLVTKITQEKVKLWGDVLLLKSALELRDLRPGRSKTSEVVRTS